MAHCPQQGTKTARLSSFHFQAKPKEKHSTMPNVDHVSREIFFVLSMQKKALRDWRMRSIRASKFFYDLLFFENVALSMDPAYLLQTMHSFISLESLIYNQILLRESEKERSGPASTPKFTARIDNVKSRSSSHSLL